MSRWGQSPKDSKTQVSKGGIMYEEVCVNLYKGRSWGSRRRTSKCSQVILFSFLSSHASIANCLRGYYGSKSILNNYHLDTTCKICWQVQPSLLRGPFCVWSFCLYNLRASSLRVVVVLLRIADIDQLTSADLWWFSKKGSEAGSTGK